MCQLQIKNQGNVEWRKTDSLWQMILLIQILLPVALNKLEPVFGHIYVKLILIRRKTNYFQTHLSANNPIKGRVRHSAIFPSDPINVSFHWFSSHVRLNCEK